MKNKILLLSILSLISACSILPSGDRSDMLKNEQSIKTMDHKNRFFVTRKGVADGYVFIIHIMPEPKGESYSRTHYHLMVSVEKNNQAITDLVVSSRVKHPDGTVEEKESMMQMGDWYMARYNLDREKGQHWIQLSFKHAGKTYSTGIYYPERVYRGSP